MAACTRPGHGTLWTRSSGGTRCRECQIESNIKAAQARRLRDRQAAVEHYGGRCVCCGETCAVFLAIDHKDNDGATHRRSLKSESIGSWLRKHGYPDEFQILCHNCNYAKHALGQCPHQTA